MAPKNDTARICVDFVFFFVITYPTLVTTILDIAFCYGTYNISQLLIEKKHAQGDALSVVEVMIVLHACFFLHKSHGPPVRL
jgi:hypothetical protein